LHEECLRLSYKELEAIGTTAYTLGNVDPLAVKYIELLCTLEHPGATDMFDHYAAIKLSVYALACD